jgi:hypothetical protein
LAAAAAHEEVVNEMGCIGIRVGRLGSHEFMVVMFFRREGERGRRRGKQECKQQCKFAHGEMSSDIRPFAPIIERAYLGQGDTKPIAKSCTNSLREFDILTLH